MVTPYGSFLRCAATPCAIGFQQARRETQKWKRKGGASCEQTEDHRKTGLRRAAPRHRAGESRRDARVLRGRRRGARRRRRRRVVRAGGQGGGRQVPSRRARTAGDSSRRERGAGRGEGPLREVG